MVSYVGYAFQTCHVITSNKRVLLLTKQLCFCPMRCNRGCLSNIHPKNLRSTVIKLWSRHHWNAR